MIDVVAAVFRDDENRVLIAQRNIKKDHGGFWEFPGGKVEEKETRKRIRKNDWRIKYGVCSIRWFI